MNSFVALTFVFAAAAAAPSVPLATHGFAAAPFAYAGAAPLAYAAAPVSVPAPYTTHQQAAGVTTVHQPAPVVTKQVHYGQTAYVSGHATRIIKPPTPHLPIAVPTVLKGSVAYNPAVVTTQKQIHTVNEPVYVERRIEVPYDVPVYQENIIQVPTPVHVDAPYNVHVPVAVQGEPIIKKTLAPAVHTTSHHAGFAAPHAAGFAAGPVAAGYGLAGGYLANGYGLAQGLLHAAE